MATQPDMSMFQTQQQGPDMSMFKAPEAKSDIRNIGRGLQGAFEQAVTHNVLIQPIRWGMEALNYGGYNEKIRQAFPGKTEEFYKKKRDELYDAAILDARERADEKVRNNPYPGQTVGNFAAGILGSASPDWLIAPGVGFTRNALKGSATQVARNVGGHIAKQAGIQGALSGATDLVAQGLDVAEGIQDNIDPTRLGAASLFGAGFGAGFGGLQVAGKTQAFENAVKNSKAPEFVKNLFLERGRDLVPEKTPFQSQVGEQIPAMRPENVQRHRDVLNTGTVDDINQFYDEVGGPRPEPEFVDAWVTNRDNLGVGPERVPEVFERQVHRDNVQAHIDDQTSTWKNKPDVRVIDSLGELSPEVRASAVKDGITPDNTVGFYSHVDGKVHIFANHIKTPEAANAVLFHESLGHYGLAQKFGNQLDSTLNSLVARNVSQFGRDVEEYMKANPKAYGGSKTRAAEEVLAEMSEAGVVPKSISNAVESAIRRFARNMGVDLTFNDAEVKHILSMAHDAVINGKGRNVVANRFGGLVQEDSTDSPNRLMYIGNQARPTRGPEGELFEGPDGMLRREISDHNASWDDEHSYSNSNGVDLDEVLIHPQLFEAYPDLRRVKVIRDTSDMGTSNLIQGYLDPHENKLHINPRAWNPASTALHEIQHWIQYKEGFALGGNQDMFRLDNKKNLQILKRHYEAELARIQETGLPRGRALERAMGDPAESVKNKLDRLDTLLESSDDLKYLYKYLDDIHHKVILNDDQVEALRIKMEKASPEKAIEIGQQVVQLNKKSNDLIQQARKAADGLTRLKGRFSDLTYDMYNILTGEIEARETQLRRNMTPEERQAQAPFTQEGFSPDEMISARNSSELNMSQEPPREATPQTLSEIDELKANPRFWSDPEYRANVIEYMRTLQPAEYTARRMTPEQLNARVANGDLDIKNLEQTYENAYKDYEPTYRSDAEVRRAAVDAGMTPSQVKRLKNIPDISARIYRSQQAADVLTQRISKLLDKEGTPDWSLRDADNLRQAIIDHNYILSKLWDDTAEVGRALRVSRMGYTKSSMEAYKELLAENGGNFAVLADDETLNRFARSLKQLMQNGANPNGINALVKGVSKPHWEEYLLSARTNMMLSGLSTHATAIQDMVNGIGFNLMDHTAGLIPSLGREGLRALGIPVKPGIHPAEVGARYWGILRAAADAMTYVNALKTLREGSSQQTSGGRQYARVPLLSKVGDLIAAEDQFFRAFSTNMHLYGLGVRKAVEDARAKGVSMSTQDLVDQGLSYARNPSRELVKEADKAAETDLLLAPNMLVAPLDALRRRANRSGKGASGDQMAADAAQRGASFVINFLLPFVRTATNSLYQRVIRRTPLTMLDPRTVADLREGGTKADVALGRIMLGTAAVAIAWEAAGKGLITGEGPENPNKKAVKMAAGWRPRATVTDTEEGQRFNINPNLGNRLNPLNFNSQTATMIAGLREAYEKGANEGQIGTGTKLAIYSTLKSLSDNVWLGDISEMITTMMEPGVAGDVKRDRLVADQLTSFVTPNLLGQIARTQDQGNPLTVTKGDLGQTIEDTFKSKIPSITAGPIRIDGRDTLPDRRTPFGEPVQGGATLTGQQIAGLPQGNRVLGGQFVETNLDPVVQEVNRLDDMFEESILTPVQRKIKIDGEEIELNNQEFSEYQQVAGEAIVNAISEMMDTDEWQEMDDSEKASWIKKNQTKIKKQVREELYGGNNEE